MSKAYERQVQTSETLIEVVMIRLLIARQGRKSDGFQTRFSDVFGSRRPIGAYSQSLSVCQVYPWLAGPSRAPRPGRRVARAGGSVGPYVLARGAG